MKNIGVVKEYNGYNGKIESLDGESYELLKKDIMSDDLTKYDSVTFVPEDYNKIEYNTKIARFVKKLDKNLLKK